MWKRLEPGWLCLALLLAAGTVAGQSRTVPYFIPDRSPSLGTLNVLPFSAQDNEVRLQFVVLPDRLPSSRCIGKSHTIDSFSLIAAESGRIEVDKVEITMAQIPSDREISRVFIENLLWSKPLPILTGVSLPANKPLFLKGDKITFSLPEFYYYKSSYKLVVELKLTGIRRGLHILGASSLVESVYARGPGSSGIGKAPDKGPGPKVSVDFLTSLPSVSSIGTANPGTTLGLQFFAPNNYFDAYQAGCAFSTSPGLDVGGYEIPLSPDSLFFTSWYLRNILFMGFCGNFGMSGFASGSIKIPDDPSLMGVTFAVAFVTMDSQTNQINGVSMEHWVTIGAGGP